MRKRWKVWALDKPRDSSTRLGEFVAHLFPYEHGHRQKAITAFVAALIVQQTCCQAGLARAFDNFEAAVKRLSRLIHNERPSKTGTPRMRSCSDLEATPGPLGLCACPSRLDDRSGSAPVGRLAQHRPSRDPRSIGAPMGPASLGTPVAMSGRHQTRADAGAGNGVTQTPAGCER